MKNRFGEATESIRGWIMEEKMRPGTLLPAGQTLADRFDLRLGTTLRACQVLISEGVLERTGYKLRVAAPAVPPPVKGTVHVLSFSKVFTRSAGRILTERGIAHAMVELTWSKHPDLYPVLRTALLKHPAGLIISTGRISRRTEALLQNSAVPCVLCTEGAERLQSSSIQFDLFRATQKAMHHLYESGHRRIAHFAVDHGVAAREQSAYYRMVCLGLGLKESAQVIWQGEGLKEEVIRDKLREGRARHPEVTGLFCHDAVAICATEIFDVPRELSVVGLHNLPVGQKSRPPLTTVGLLDPEAEVRCACAELLSQIESAESALPRRGPTKYFLGPDLILRKSTRAVSPAGVAGPETSEPVPALGDPGETWRKIYPYLKRNRTENWIQLDLAKVANHSMTRQHGWLGAEPLEYFPPGLRSIHGVPFLVLDEARNRGSSVVTFRSPHSHSAGKRQLPVRAEIKVKSRARAVYFLHGCAHARPLPFAEYILHFLDGESRTLPLVPFGPSLRWRIEPFRDLQPNLQDWWAGFDQDDFPHAHHATIFNPADPAAYERTLYSLEWINPRPRVEISRIEVRVNPKAGPVLALVAATALI